jgi:hypothetical protein
MNAGLNRTPCHSRLARFPGKTTAVLGTLCILGVAISGCAAIRNHEAIQKERLLAAAGFQMKLADTPAKIARLETLPQRKLVPHTRTDGTLYYLYADAGECKCLYVGTEAAYQRYQKICVKQQIAEDNRMTAQMNEDAAMDWGMWEPWGPWW